LAAARRSMNAPGQRDLRTDQRFHVRLRRFRCAESSCRREANFFRQAGSLVLGGTG